MKIRGYDDDENHSDNVNDDNNNNCVMMMIMTIKLYQEIASQSNSNCE